MKKNNNIVDDLARLAGSTFAGAVNMKDDMSSYIKSQIEIMIKKLDFVPRKEFEILKAIVQKNAIEIENLKEKKDT
ncbi:MAG: BMFP domain-containing protein YqiC [Candidatus Midichloriaceae bacterium]|jgi:BMFP domain-containing protein YqiC